ncbi:MAG: hypothetical protein ABIJ91_04815 [Candidatus Kuenenbacteria bacterium]
MDKIKYKLPQERLFSEPKYQEAMHDIKKRTYWDPTQQIFDKKLKNLVTNKKIEQKDALVIILDYLTEILVDSNFDLAYVSDIKKANLSDSVQPLSKIIDELNKIYA